MRRPEFHIPVITQDGKAVRQWVDFFMDIWTGVGQIKGTKFVSAVIDFGSIAAATTVTSNVTVAGARANDIVALGLPATLDGGISWDAHVSADDTVTIRATNATAGAIDPASATYKVMVTMN